MKSTLIGLFVLVASVFDAGADEHRGQAVFARWCVHCHGTQAGAPGRLKLEWTRGIDYSVLSERDDLQRDYIRAVVRRGQAEMPSFRRTEISDADLDALAVYLTRKQ